MALADAEDLGATSRADVLNCRPVILHDYGLGIFHFPLGLALNTIGLHWSTSFLITNDKVFPPKMSTVYHRFQVKLVLVSNIKVTWL